MSDEILIGYIPYPAEEGARLWRGQDRLAVIGMCQQARHRPDLRAARGLAEAALPARLSSGGHGALLHGWLRKLNSGREGETGDGGPWRGRLCLAVGGELAHASEKGQGGDGARVPPRRDPGHPGRRRRAARAATPSGSACAALAGRTTAGVCRRWMAALRGGSRPLPPPAAPAGGGL
jgi:hypothetical protein